MCQGMRPAEADRLFFPTPRGHRAMAEARQLCGRCPVRTECFNHALDNAIPEGIWGSLTASERLAWRKKAADRLDHNRVRAAFRGRDVHLSTPERRSSVPSSACLPVRPCPLPLVRSRERNARPSPVGLLCRCKDDSVPLTPDNLEP
ncbi:WhiB family transcriptional regulator [Streptomyces sp. SF28]|nr:WhiB family transcriptional regulator [Streptomyces pinistramenti]